MKRTTIFRFALVVGALLLGAACAHERPYIWVHDLPVASGADGRIQPGDTLLVEVKDQPAASGEFVVREDGHYLQPNVGSVRVAGLQPKDVSASVAVLLKNVFVDAAVKVWLAKRPPIKVQVIGEVKTPGVFELNQHRTVLAALAAAGWLTEFAHRDQVFVIRSGTDTRRIRFRVEDLTTPERHSAAFRLRDGDVVAAE